jgi:hypothetical protein
MLSTDMSQKTHTPTPLAAASTREALDRAQALVATPPQTPASAVWTHEASQVGDLSVLALALLAA